MNANKREWNKTGRDQSTARAANEATDRSAIAHLANTPFAFIRVHSRITPENGAANKRR